MLLLFQALHIPKKKEPFQVVGAARVIFKEDAWDCDPMGSTGGTNRQGLRTAECCRCDGSVPFARTTQFGVVGWLVGRPGEDVDSVVLVEGVLCV